MIKFSFQNPESPLQFTLPNGIPDVVHKSPVYLSTKTILRDKTTLMEYVEAKVRPTERIIQIFSILKCATGI